MGGPSRRWPFDPRRTPRLAPPSRPPGTPGTARRPAPGADVEAYRGLRTWIDLYDVSWAHPGVAVRRMRARGVRTLYLETSNFNRGRPFVYKEDIERFLDAAQRNGISVVARYLPGLRDLDRDFRRSVEAIWLRTAAGNRFASFAMDIESDEIRKPAARTRRLLALSDRLRWAVGGGYPLGAIIPSPLALERNAWYWRGSRTPACGGPTTCSYR